MDIRFSYAQLPLDKVYEVATDGVGCYRQVGNGPEYQSLLYRVYDQLSDLGDRLCTVEIWPTTRQAYCTCSTSEHQHLCQHLALVLAEDWDALHPARKPGKPKIYDAPEPEELIRLHFQTRPRVLARLEKLRERYNDPATFKGWYCS